MSDFIITKKTTVYYPCHKCDETGVLRRTFRNKTYIENCPKCDGKGRIAHHIREDVNLIDVLKDLKVVS